MGREIKNCVAVVNGTFCNCGGVMKPAIGLLMSDPPQRKMLCPFCGDSRVVLDSDSDTNIDFRMASDE